MIDPSTDAKETKFGELVEKALSTPFHYIKRDRIVEKIELDGRVFFSRFERIDGAADRDTIDRHIRGETTLALPLYPARDSHSLTAIVGIDDSEGRLEAVSGYLLDQIGVENYLVYRDSEDSVWIVMQTDTTGIVDAYDFVSNISKMLEKRLQKSWKILPDPTLPDSYNIFVLPSSAI